MRDKFKVSLLHEEISEIKKKFVGCYAPWLKDDIYAVTNIGVEILIYIQIFILVKAPFFRGNSTIQLHHKKWTKPSRFFEETDQKSGNYCKQFMV